MDPGGIRYALGCLRLRGGSRGAGQVAATDGMQLLVQGGFDFPWNGDRLVPAPRLFAARELDADVAAEVGGTAGADGKADQVVVRVGDWTFRLAIDAAGRFPAIDAHVSAEGVAAGAVELSDADRRFLADSLAGLPGADGGDSPVTLDLNGRVLVRAQGTEDARPTELALPSSRRTGPAIAVATRRGPLARALGLGFGAVRFADADSPAVCRDERRAFVWATLGKDAVVPAAEDALRGASEGERIAAAERRPASPRPASPPSPKKGLASADAELRRPATATTSDAAPGLGREVAEGFADLIGRADRLKGTLRDLAAEVRDLSEGLRRQRRRSRLVRGRRDDRRDPRPVGEAGRGGPDGGRGGTRRDPGPGPRRLSGRHGRRPGRGPARAFPAGRLREQRRRPGRRHGPPGERGRRDRPPVERQPGRGGSPLLRPRPGPGRRRRRSGRRRRRRPRRRRPRTGLAGRSGRRPRTSVNPDPEPQRTSTRTWRRIISHPHHHALSSVRAFGGTAEDFLPLHDFLDSSKGHFADVRHRAVLHHSFGIHLAERVFGPVIRTSTGREVPTRVVAERHVVEDLGRIPTLADWLRHLHVAPWMRRAAPLRRTDRFRPAADGGETPADG